MTAALRIDFIGMSLNRERRLAMKEDSKLNDLIRGELAAVKSYDTALSKIKDEKERQTLSTMRSDHERAVDSLKKFAHSEVRAEESSGAWGSFAQSFTTGASLFGDKAAMSALKTGEEHGINDYKRALDDDSIDMQLKEVIRTELLPNQERHINTINSFM
jgi:demethoxyubiquinone hydroxylase (CLK1/Coq7/Cat5 family)